jgi:hypothetical protein
MRVVLCRAAIFGLVICMSTLVAQPAASQQDKLRELEAQIDRDIATDARRAAEDRRRRAADDAERSRRNCAAAWADHRRELASRQGFQDRYFGQLQPPNC